MDRHRLLILGAPRSGTTLLGAILGSHPDITILNEPLKPVAHHILSKRVVGDKLCIPYNIDLDRRNGRVMRSIRKNRRIRHGLIGLGYPAHVWSIRDYQRRIEGLRMILIVRDPENVVASNERRSYWNAGAGRRWWSRAVEVLHLLHQESPETVDVVSYDRLVTCPREVAARLVQPFGLCFDERMLEGYLHTPQYQGNTRIDPSKATWRTSKDIPMLADQPELGRKYDELLAASV